MRLAFVLLLSSCVAAQCSFNGQNYEAALKAGEFRPLCHFAFANHGKGIMAGIQIDTDSDNVDSAAAIRIDNLGRSDAIWIGVKGKPGNQASRPTGIGIDLNRSTGDHENSPLMNGFGLQVWDWSERDQGLNGPAAIYIQKVHNLDSGHRAIWILSNRSAITLETRNAADPSATLVDVTDGKHLYFKISAGGDLYANSAAWGSGQPISSSSLVAQYVGSIKTSPAQQDSLKFPSASHCQAQATNREAAVLSQWVSIENGSVILHHESMAGATFDLFCTSR
jgi:hypothetical protein